MFVFPAIDLLDGKAVRLKQGRYEILAIETRRLDQGELTEIIWERDDGPDAITEAELPF